MTSIQGGVVGEDGVEGDVEGDDPGQEEEGEAPAAHVEPTQEMVDAIFDEIFDEDPDFVCDQTALKRRRTSESERTAAGTTEIADGTISDPETMKFSDGEIFDAPVQAEVERPAVAVPRKREVKASQKARAVGTKQACEGCHIKFWTL